MSTNKKPKLNDEEVLRQAKETLATHLPLEADGYCTTSEMLYDILLAVAAGKGTVESVCSELAGAPDPETIRRYFREQLTVEGVSEVQRRINGGFVANWPRRVATLGPHEVAV